MKNRLFFNANIKSLKEGEFEVIASNAKTDRYGDTINPDGWVLTNYRKNPVILWSHMSGGFGMPAVPPVARATKVWVEDGMLKAKGLFAPTPFAQELRTLVENGFLNAVSVGFLPLIEDEKGNMEIDHKMYRRANEEEMKEFAEKGCFREGTKFEKQELLEISWVAVPALPSALVTAREMGLQLITKELEMEIIRGVIPFKATSKAPEDEEWDGGKEVREAEVSDLKIMCAWYDSEEPDIKSSYKLPHHKAKGYSVVWRGVAAAMAVLLGARGGVKIPSNDKKGVYNHLVGHYKQFDKEPPEFKSYSEEELQKLFGEFEIKPYANEHACRLEDPGKYKRFRRKNCEVKHDGKCIDVIYGITKGEEEKAERQSLRYDKKIWTAASAKSHCKDNDGSFEAASEEENTEDYNVCKCGSKGIETLHNYPAEGIEVLTTATISIQKCKDCGRIRKIKGDTGMPMKLLEEIEIKEGRVLSEKNRKLINNCLKQMGEAIDVLKELLIATEPEKGIAPIENKGCGQDETKGRVKPELRLMRLADKAVENTLKKLKENRSSHRVEIQHLRIASKVIDAAIIKAKAKR